MRTMIDQQYSQSLYVQRRVGIKIIDRSYRFVGSRPVLYVRAGDDSDFGEASRLVPLGDRGTVGIFVRLFILS